MATQSDQAADGESRSTPPSPPSSGGSTGISRAFWTLTGNMAYAAFQWGLLAAIARLHSPELVGRFAISFAIVAPIMMFTSFQLRQLQATDVSRQFYFGDFATLRLIMSGTGILAVAASAAIAGFDSELIWITVLLAFWRGLELISDLCFGQFQQDDRLDLVGKSNLVRAVLFMLLFAGALAATGDLMISVATLTGGSLIMIIVWDLPKLRFVLRQNGKSPWRFRWRWETMKILAWEAFPLGLIILIASLEINMPRYFVHSSLGERDLGIFAALAATTMAMQTVTIAVYQSALTPLARAWKAGNLTLFRLKMIQLAGFGLAFGIAGVIGGVLLGEFALNLVFGADYAERNDLFVLLLSAFALLIVVHAFQIAARAMKRNWWPLSVRIVSIGAMTAACVYLIPRHGLHGAAWAVLTGGAVGALCSVVLGGYLTRRGLSSPVDSQHSSE